MLEIRQSSKFKKDRKRSVKRGCDQAKLKNIIARLANQEVLNVKHRAHTLGGEYSDCWECHIEPDWLLIWRYVDDSEIILERTGSHSDLFR